MRRPALGRAVWPENGARRVSATRSPPSPPRGAVSTSRSEVALHWVVTVIWNGVMVHDDVEIGGKTGRGRKEGPEPGPFWLQDHGSAVEFRNVWVEAR